MFYILLICFFIFFIEILIFIRMIYIIGFLVSLFFLIFTSFLGFLLIRSQGYYLLIYFILTTKNNIYSINEIIKNISILLSGIFFLIPGYLTDFIGFLLLIPIIQKIIIKKIIINFFKILI